ncbi:hypothetical protein ACS0TY_000532 [Phlomoides rotata]
MEIERTKSEDGNGGVNLPIGFRFHPTDEELVLHYLKRKVFSLPLPATVIPELEVFHSNPSDLPGDLKEKRYFFCKRRSNFLKNCSSINSDCGYWKATGKDKQIMIPGSNIVIGIKKSFVFYQGRKLKTQWIMHEFCLVGSLNSPCLTQRLMMQVGDWVVCRLYQRKKRGRHQGIINKLAKSKKSRISSGIMARDPLIGGEDEVRASPSSCSSEITEVSYNDVDLDHEASSRRFSF